MDYYVDSVMTKTRGCKCGQWSRFMVLIFLSIMGFCGMFVYDIPGSLQESIMNGFSLSNFQFSLLYSLYSWPSVVVCFFGGFLIDRFFGVKLAAILFAIVQIIGASIFVLGGFFDTFWFTLLGRFVFGIGGELCGVCVNIFVLIWFKGKELNMVFAVIQNILRLGTSGVYLVSSPLLTALKQKLSSTEALNFTLLILSSAVLIPLMLSFILAFMYPVSQNINDTSANQMKQAFNDIRISDISRLPVTFWLLCFSLNLYNHIVFTFLTFTQEFFTSQFHMSVESANQMSSLFNIIPVVLSTLLGIIVDRKGRNMIFILSGVIAAIIAHIFAITHCSPYLIIVTFAVSNSLMISSVLPTIAYTVNISQQGTAYGINQSSFNLILSCGSLIVGWIINDYGFFYVEIYYLVCGSIVLCTFMVVWWLDRKRKNVVNMSLRQRQKYEESLLI